MKHKKTKVLILPSWYTNEANVNRGIFFKEQAIALNDSNLDISVLYVDFLKLGDLKFSNFYKFLFYKSYVVEDTIKTYRLNGINLVSLRFEIGRKLWFYFALNLFKEYLKKEGKPDLIYAHSYFAGYIASQIKSKFDIPYILTEHSSNIFKEENLLWHDKYIKTAFKDATVLSAVSHSLRLRMKNKYIRSEKNIQIIPNFINTSFFNTDKAHNRSSTKTILTIGNLIDVKNHQLLINAFHQSGIFKNDWVLKIGGKGNLKETLINQINQLGLKDNIELLGELTREQVRSQMAGAHFFVLSSKVETFGVVIIEAMAMGLPVLATKCGGPEMLVSKDTGIIVENDLQHLLKGLKVMSTKFDTYNSEFIKTQITNNYSNTAVVENIISLLESKSLI